MAKVEKVEEIDDFLDDAFSDSEASESLSTGEAEAIACLKEAISEENLTGSEEQTAAEKEDIDDLLDEAMSEASSEEQVDVDDYLDDVMSEEDETPESSRPCSSGAEGGFSSEQEQPEEELELAEQADIVDELFDEDALSDEDVSPELRRILSPNKAIFSINGYRRRTMSLANLGQTPEDPRCSASLSSCSYDSETNSDNTETLSHHDYRKRIMNLHACMKQEDAVLAQTSNALNQCSLGPQTPASLAAQVECNKILLVASQRREAIFSEIEKLRAQNDQDRTDTGIGCLTITDIQLPLTREFMDKTGTEEDKTEHFFILLVRNREQIYSTQMVSTHKDDALINGTLSFPNTFKLNDVPNNFHFEINVFSMQVDRDTKKPVKKSGKIFSRSNTIVKDLISNVFGTASSANKRRKSFPGTTTNEQFSEQTIRRTAFQHITSLTVTPESMKQLNFFLHKVTYLSPLQGTVHMTLNCDLQSNIVHSGFVNVMDDVSGFGACRHRRWCVLEKDRLCFWQYPEDEHDKEPLAEICLKNCVTPEIAPVSRTICGRPNTIEISTIKCTNLDKPGTMTMSRKLKDKNHEHYWLLLDTSHERVEWCKKLNQALCNIRQWSVDAVRPLQSIRSSCIY